MDTAKRDAFEHAGINVDSALRRFMDDEKIYCSFLYRFLSDNLMSQLSDAIADGDVRQAFEVAHTMKGVCANLSLDSINNILNPMVEVLRKGSLDGLNEEYEKLSSVYSEVNAVIKQYCQA